MRRVTQRDLRNLYEPAPRELYDGIHGLLADLPNQRRVKKVKKKISVGFILAAALLLLSAAAIAVDQWDLFRPQTHSAAPILPLEGAEKLVETNLGRTENEWLTATIEQAAYDGQGMNALVRLTPKDTEHNALFNSWLMDAPGDVYDIYSGPMEVPEGTQESDIMEGGVRIVNEGGVQAYFEAGEEVPIPESREAAMAAGCLVFRENGKLWYTHQDEFRATGRKDGKAILGFDVSLRAASDDPALASLTDGMGSDAEAQPDGSVLVWIDASADEPLPDTIELNLRVYTSPDGEWNEESHIVDDIPFTLTKSESGRVARYVPENGGIIDDHIRVREVSLNLTKLRAYLTVDYDYEAREDEEMGVWLHPCDAAGNPIATGGGHLTDSAEPEDFSTENAPKLGFWRQRDEMQSFDELPEVIVLEAKVIGGDLLGQCVCRLAEED